ncbi:MAG: hypothetical protein AAF600_03935 [Bacteroidota bacterium]
MTRNLFQLEYSAWWVILILLISTALSYFLYSKRNIPWNIAQNWVLFGIRLLGIFFILLLFLEPSIKKVVNTVKNPIIFLALDNSQSVIARNADSITIKEKINFLEKELLDQGVEVKTILLSDADSIVFDHRTSRLSDLFASIDNSDVENHVATILLTDGIYNRGSSPLYRNYLEPVFTVGMGDTIPPKDISISRTRYNKVTYKGNETPLRFEINQQGYTGKNTSIALIENGKQIAIKNLKLHADIQEVEFLISSNEEGLRHLVGSIPVENDESTEENNRTDIFLEVIDGKQKILIVASAPHPDIKAIRRALDETDSYSTELYIPSIADEKPRNIYDVVVYHGAFNSGISYAPMEQPGRWFILNSESMITSINKSLPYIKIKTRGGQPDKVTGSFNQNFSKFTIENTEIFEEYPPIEVPYGDYFVTGSSEILMYQKLGSVLTNKPLMVFNEDGSQKSAVLIGENIWKWKLREAAINDNSLQFDNFITKTVQFLSVKNDKKQFRFKSRSSTFSDSEPVLFDVEVYNDIYERIYENAIDISIIDENKESQSYEFTDSELNNTFRAPSLSPGVYRYTASVKVGESTFKENGEFLVENINSEYLNLTANHRLLKNLSFKTDGQFIHYDEIERLPEIMKTQNYKPILTSNEDYQELAKIWWYFLIIFVLFSIEWFLRRYWGGY